MKKESKKRIISLLMCLVMVFGLMPTPVFATTYVDFLTTSNAVEFVITGETGFHRVNLNNNKVDSLPVVYRTDSLDLEFDGWYTAKEGGEKVTTNTEFDSYAILYDRWKASNIDSEKIVDSVEIKVVDPTNGTTALDWYNSCTLSIVADGVQNMSSIALYNCLNAFGTQLNNNDVLDTSKDYSIVALLRLEDGYYFDENISITSYEGVRAGILYQGNGTNTNYWNSIATQALVTINFPAGGNNNVGFTIEPQSGVVNEENAYNFTWAVDGQPIGAQLQMKDGNDWVILGDLTINQNGTISARTGTETFRIVVNYTSGSICSNEFTVTWFDPNDNSFSMHPTSGTVNNGTDFYYTWACVHTPYTAILQRKVGDDWTSPEELGSATARKITYDNAYENTTQTFRIYATYGTNNFSSNEFTVTYKEPLAFTTQPSNGRVAIGKTYTVDYEIDIGNEQFNQNDSILQVKNGGNWVTASAVDVFLTEAVVPAQDNETTKTYRVGLKIGSNMVYSNEFTVQWIDDYTFELDKNTLAWGDVDKADVYEDKMITVTPNGTIKPYTDNTLKCSVPTSFSVQEWHSPDDGYSTLTFTPKSSLSAGTYNETIYVWATNGNVEINKTSVTLSINIIEPTYTITFNAGDGGSGEMTPISNVSGSYELPECTFEAPTGKEFKAWYVNGNEKAVGESITVDDDITITALWKDKPAVVGYTVSFDNNGGTGTMADVNGVTGTYSLPACTFGAPSDQQFHAWDVDGQEYQPGIGITITSNTTVKAVWADIPVNYYTVYFSSANVCGIVGSYNATQYVEQEQAMIDIIVTANDGYYFPTDFNVQAQNGVNVTRLSYTQLKIAGTPTDNVSFQFGPNTKTKEDKPTSVEFIATDSDKGYLNNVENGVAYSVTGAATAEFTATGTTYDLTNVTQGELQIVKKASDINTKLDSDVHTYPVGKINYIPNLYHTNCSDSNNNDGSIWNVSVEMEYRKSTDNNWTTGTGNNVENLVAGTYYVRYKATSINLASDNQTIVIAEYGVATLTGDVEVTGIKKFGEVLTATVTNTNNTGTLSYQWIRNVTNISGANGETYTIVDADIGSPIRVRVSSSVETGNIESDPTENIEKADGLAISNNLIGVAPTTDGGADGKITGTTTDMEYSSDTNFTTSTNCMETETTGLTAGTYYVRMKETTTHKAGANKIVTVPEYSNIPNPKYTVTVTLGTATPTEAEQGATVTITAEAPVQGKEFDKWVVNAGGVTLASETSATTTFEMGTANVEVTATYKDIAQNPTTYTVKFNSKNGSTVADITGVTSGSTIQKPTNPTRSGYTFVGWYKEEELTNEFNFATDTITSDTTLFAKWKVKQTSSGGGGSSVTKYEIKVTAGIGGKISPETTKVEKGDSKKFTITADEGYEIEDVLVDGKSVGVVESYKFEKVKEKHTIEATFKKIEEIKDTEEDTIWENPFEDVTEDAWYYEAVEFANENNLFSGMSAKEFGPSVAMTRGMFVTVLSKLNGGEIDGEADFVDVDPNAYYAKPVAWAYSKGIVNGVGNNKFAPNMSITREQLAVMMYNYMVVEQIDKPASLVEFPEFADAEEISDWAINAVNVMRATGLMSGKPGNKFDPKGTATRAEVATILMNFCK